ncbi:MAG: hypothetical protein LBH19_15235 [Dysgonamonadaceae bacterium]|nr:hypothetical protein [Dysgonamonadaceae bacterium]
MQNKQYIITEPEPCKVAEPTVEYVSTGSNRWNPNVPFHGTQEEWNERFQTIANGKFMSAEEFKTRFAKWKKDFLASRMK